MNPLDFIEDHFYDYQEGLRNLLVWFLNSVMLEEAAQQSCSEPYEPDFDSCKNILHSDIP